MGWFLSSHSAPNVSAYGLPPAELIEELVDRTTNPPHWLWDGNVNRHGEPVLRWATGKTWPGTYVVARVLATRAAGLEGKSGPIRIASRCGVVACVNPEHWQVVSRSTRFVVVTDFDGKGERVVPPLPQDKHALEALRKADLEAGTEVVWRGEAPCSICRALPRQKCLAIAHERDAIQAKAGRPLWNCLICGAQNGLPCGPETHKALHRPL